MDATTNGKALETWFREHGGYLNPSVDILYSPESGYRWQSNNSLPPGTRVTTVPHSIALSYLNALVDDAFPVFRERRHDFKIEALGFFYLMAQYVNQERSFWKPYLDALPPPDLECTTPLWYDDVEDLAWLEGTDVLHTMLGRREVYKQYYQAGLLTLKATGIDISPYTWDLFRWSITMFTSRCFSSRAIAPHASKYWTTYKHTSAKEQRSQTVLLDMSHAPAEDLDFSVLFPVQDASNHNNDTHVDWAFDPGRFSISLNDPVPAGCEIFNNYGAKGNDELLMGFGFCIPDNRYDSVMLTFKPPSSDLQFEVRRVHPGYFSPSGQWDSERGTFRLRRFAPVAEAKDIFNSLPEALLELLLYILRHERGLSFAFYELPREYLTTNPSGRRYLPHIARMIVQSLAPKLQKLQGVSLPSKPTNNKQRQASIYRSGQIEIMQATIAALRAFIRSLLKPPTAAGPRFATLEDLLKLWSHRTSPKIVAPFIAGIEAVSGTADVDQLRQAGWEDDVMVLLLCHIYLDATRSRRAPLSAICEGEVAAVPVAQDPTTDWATAMLPEYIDIAAPHAKQSDTEVLAHAEGLMGLIATAASHVDGKGSLWGDARWCPDFIAELGGKFLRFESMTVMVPGPSGESEDARLVVYLHHVQ